MSGKKEKMKPKVKRDRVVWVMLVARDVGLWVRGTGLTELGSRKQWGELERRSGLRKA